MCIKYSKVPGMYGGIILLPMAWFSIKSFEKDYKYFFINFSGLQPEFFTIFNSLNSTGINTFKGIKRFLVPFIYSQ